MLAHKYAYDTNAQPEEGIDYEDVAGNFKMVKQKEPDGMYRGPGVGRMRNAADWNKKQSHFGGIKGGEKI